METKLAIVLACLFAGCGLDTAGQGQADDGWTDIVPDEIEPDLADSEPDVLDLAEVEPPPEATDEASADEADGATDEAAPEAEDVSGEDGGEEAEDVHDVTDEGGEGDSEVTDPCAPPEIPTTGLYFFYCVRDGWLTDLTLERWVDRAGTGLPDDLWGVEPDCIDYDTRSLFCEVRLTGPGTLNFNIRQLSMPWACDHLTTPYAYGTPRLWWDGTELALGDPVWNGDTSSDGCNYTCVLPTP